jgi:hypothetical protein
LALALPLSLRNSRIHLPASRPSAQLCFLRFSQLSPLRYHEGSDSYAAHHPQRRSPRLPHHTFLSFRLQPRGLPDHRLPPRQRDQRVSDFAMNEQARRSSPPNRVRSPTDQQFASGCSPPRFAATQLPSATEFVAYSGTDFHRADLAPSRAHSFRLPPVSLQPRQTRTWLWVSPSRFLDRALQVFELLSRCSFAGTVTVPNARSA